MVASQTLREPQNVRIPTRVFETSGDGVRHVVMMIENLIRERQSAGLPCVLGLPTGSTPVGVYRELVRLHREESLDFAHVVTFNLDEYFPMNPTDAPSYHRFMRENLFDHVNIKPRNTHVPNGSVSIEDLDDACFSYEQQIRRAGGLDLLLLGIGRNGHIAFNEPGSTRTSRTRATRLDPLTRRDAASGFHGEENVPNMAITVGVGTILDAKKIVMMAFGEHKSEIIQRTLEEPVTENIPASFLQEHDDAVFVLDKPAAAGLTYFKTPWVLGHVEWTDALIRRAVLWLAFQTKKPLLKLTAGDFHRHNLHELLRDPAGVHALCQKVFDEMSRTICPEPGGSTPAPILCFSPHPDDDVISMGGTLLKLRRQGHDVHIAYMTSGNVAVFDHDAMRFANFAADFNRMFKIESEKTSQIEQTVYDFLAKKTAGQVDSDEVLAIKGLVRKTEATAAAKALGISDANLHFLDLPFYQTGRIAKKGISEADIARVLSLLEEVRPAQIYVAGDLADPHGTHRICADACFEATRRYRAIGGELEVWLYRGAWQEWEPHQIERSVPLSPEELDRKKSAIFRHESQKDRAMFPGSTDTREFWQRAEDRNRQTADWYDQLGLPEYYAMESFVQWKGAAI